VSEAQFEHCVDELRNPMNWRLIIESAGWMCESGTLEIAHCLCAPSCFQTNGFKLDRLSLTVVVIFVRSNPGVLGCQSEDTTTEVILRFGRLARD